MSVVVAEGVVEVTADAKNVGKDIAKDIERGGGDVAVAGGVLGGQLSGGIKSGLVKVGAVVAGALIAATAAVGIGVGAIVANGVKFESAMQNYTAAFTPLLGGADAAKAKLGELSAFAASTPFEMTGLADASQTLLSFGEGANDLLPDLRMLGDISQGNQEKLSGLALVFGQVQSSGRLMGQDVLQMINQGFNPLVEISKITGESMVDLKARMEAGGVSFDEVRGAMQHATAEGGMFFNAMQLGSETLTGSWSSTKDGVNILSGAIVGDLTPALTGVLSEGINPLLGGLVDLVNGVDGAQGAVDTASQNLLNQVENIGPAIGDIAGNLGTVFDAVAPALSSAAGTLIGGLTTLLPSVIGLAGKLIDGLLKGIADNGPALITAAVPVILGFATGLLGQIPTLITASFAIVQALVTGVAAALPTLIPQVVTAVVGALITIFAPENLGGLLTAALSLVTGLVTGILTALPVLIEALPAIIIGIIDFLVAAIPQIIDTGIALLLSLVEALPEIITGIVTAIPKIITAIILATVQLLPKIISAGVDLFISLIDNLPLIITTLVGAIPQIVTGLVNALSNPTTIGQLATAGGDLLKGLWTGISDLAGWLWTKVSGLFDDLTDKIKDFFGIASPSKLMHDEVGTMLGRGIGGGFIDGLLGQRKGILGALDGLVGTVNGGLGNMGINVTGGGPGDGFDGSGLGPGKPGGAAGALLVSGGDTFVIENVTLDASNVEDFTRVVEAVKALPQVARTGRGKVA